MSRIRVVFHPTPDQNLALSDFEFEEPEHLTAGIIGGKVAQHATRLLNTHKKYAGWKVEILTQNRGHIELGKSGAILKFGIVYK